MTTFQWLAGGLMLGLVALEVLLQLAGRVRRSISTIRLMVWATAAFFLFYPQATIRIANSLSIGRGADLLLYVTVIAFLLSFFYVIHAIERHREQLTALVRQIAIMEPYARPMEVPGAGGNRVVDAVGNERPSDSDVGDA